jgi:hypothetical protein
MKKARMWKDGNTLPDMEDTKEHILAAGRELMLAADGALRFCRAYAETLSPPASRSQLTSFFSKAIAVADELGKGLVSATCVKRTAQKAAAPIFEAFGREMMREERTRKATAIPKARAQTRKKASGKTAARRSGTTHKGSRPNAARRRA